MEIVVKPRVGGIVSERDAPQLCEHLVLIVVRGGHHPESEVAELTARAERVVFYRKVPVGALSVEHGVRPELQVRLGARRMR